jgi:hypothetical protein
LIDGLKPLGVCWQYQIIRHTVKYIRAHSIIWWGHLNRVEVPNTVRKITEWNHIGMISKGRPKNRCKDEVVLFDSIRYLLTVIVLSPGAVVRTLYTDRQKDNNYIHKQTDTQNCKKTQSTQNGRQDKQNMKTNIRRTIIDINIKT